MKCPVNIAAAVLVLVPLFAGGPLLAQEGPTIREAAAARRALMMTRMPDGLAIIQSADRSQPNLYEFFVPETEHHDFLYLTGIDTVPPPGAVLVLNPRGTSHREVLYTAGDVDEAKKQTGIEHVFRHDRFLEDLSSALTDFRNLRITQLRFKPVASDFSRGWGEGQKVVYFNYPRFTNLNEPANPRLGLVAKLQEASPKIEMRDAADILDRMRMIQDDYALAQLRRAIDITGKGLMEAMRVARPGLTTREVMEVADFVYRLNGATLGFPTGVAAGLQGLQIFATAREEVEAREGSSVIQAGDLVWFDTGAAYNRYSADIQRQVPASGRFTEEQRRLYTIVLDVQKAVIAAVKPGVTWDALQALAIGMLQEAGGLDESYTYGIGHFIGMEVHDHGDYVEPLQPGMVISIEQGAILNGLRVAFEDDVLVTPTGHEWLTRFIPIEIDEIEQLRTEKPTLDPLPLLLERPATKRR
ncbi:aminopeptidase P family protein [soil metagenome]|nr:aminopeptidase P N-terminal domain-containing protein [Acidobacteriota bacterium]